MTRQKATDAGLAFVLILLLIALAMEKSLLVGVAAAAVLVCMVAPGVFVPFAVVWFGLSHVLGAVMSRVVLAIVYFLLVFPVAMARRLAGKDPMMRKQWKKGDGSVFTDRNHTFIPEDMEHPY